MTREVAYVIENDSGNYDVWLNGREILALANLGYQAALSRARDVIRRKGGGDIVIEKLDGTVKIEVL